MMRLLFSSRQAPLTTASIFTALATTFRSARAAFLIPGTRPFSYINRLRQAPVRSAEEEAARAERQRLQHNAWQRQRYANDPELRQKRMDYLQTYKRDPVRRIGLKTLAKARRLDPCYKKYIARPDDLGRRRAKRLDQLLRTRYTDTFVWKTHTCIRYPDRIAHHCTGCSRNRFLATWWKEKPNDTELSEEPAPDRYMCSYCFVNDWPRVVPETYTGTLYDIFRSPELPPPYVQKRAELTTEKDTESDRPQKP